MTPKIICAKNDFAESIFTNIFITLPSQLETKIWV